jgi:hypothetical protein
VEWRTEAAGILSESGGHQHQRLLMLERALPIQKVEEFVLDNRPADATISQSAEVVYQH